MLPMDSRRTTNRLLLIITLFLVVAALKFAQPVFIALLLTVLLVYVMEPIVSFLQRKGFPLWLATLAAVILFTAFFFGLFLLLVRDLSHFGRAFPHIQEELANRAQNTLQGIEEALGTRLNVDLFEELRNLPVAQGMLNAVRGASRIVSEFFLIFFFAILLLLGKHHAIDKMLGVFPKRLSVVPVMLKQIDQHLRIFLGIKALAGLAVGLGTGIILYVFGVQFAVTWGFLAFLMNFVPALGPITAVIIPVLTSMVQFSGLLMPLVIALCLAAVHLGVSGLIEPKFMGRHLNLSFFVIFLSLFFWGWLWGPAGVLLAVPVTTSLKIIIERIPATAHLARLLESTRIKPVIVEVEERLFKGPRKRKKTRKPAAPR